MDNYAALQHMKECNRFSQTSAVNLKRTLSFVLATIQQSLETVPTILADYDKLGRESRFAYGSKREGLDFIEDNAPLLYHAAMLARGDEERLLEVFTAIPGLGLVKAGFACQLFASKVGCIDTHNLTLYGVPVGAVSMRKNSSPALQARKRKDYISLCRTLGGSIELWARWCDYKATREPSNWANAGFSVSKFHVEVLEENYQENPLAFIKYNEQADFEVAA